MASQLPINNVVTISASQASPGIGAYNTSNLGLFTDEAPNLNTFGNLGFASYLTPTQVGVDFGTGSKTYQMANAIFSQQPNILNGNGQLVVILLTNEVDNFAFSGVAASGTFQFSYNSNLTSAINWNDTLSQIQTKVRAVAGLESAVVTGSVATSLNVKLAGVYSALALTTTGNTLQTSAPAAIVITKTVPTVKESLAAAITRTSSLVQFFGIIASSSADVIGSVDMLAAAAVVQSLNKIAFFVSNQDTSIAADGLLDKLRTGSLTKSRGLYYGDSVSLNAVLMMAAYASKAISVNFSGSNTTTTMHLKVLASIQPDPTITQTLLTSAIAAGADTYISLQGVPAVFCSGLNRFFDQVYNQEWLVGALQVAGFNYLAQSSTKIPQTEQGMDGLKGAYRTVCEQGVTNQYIAAGSWTSPTTFGVQAQLVANVSQRGYYIYSTPISTQLQADRAARKAPLIQIAIKEAGAIQSSTVIVTVNA